MYCASNVLFEFPNEYAWHFLDAVLHNHIIEWWFFIAWLYKVPRFKVLVSRELHRTNPAINIEQSIKAAQFLNATIKESQITPNHHVLIDMNLFYNNK